MQGALEQFLSLSILAFLLTFVRVGTALMIMPGLGDSFIPERVRLFIALGLSLVLFPVVMPYLPAQVPSSAKLFPLIGVELVIGLLIGTVSRIMMMALDTAGMVVSSQSGLANAQVFNPSFATQGSVMGAFLTMTGVLVLMMTDLHHMLIIGVVESYQQFPVGKIPDTGSMAEVITRAVAVSFSVGIKITTPFIVLTLLIYVLMGVLSRLMPQIQVFMIALPLQILLSVVLLMLCLGFMMSVWTREFESVMLYFIPSQPPAPLQ